MTKKWFIINSLGHQILLNLQLVRAVNIIFTFKLTDSLCTVSIYFSVLQKDILINCTYLHHYVTWYKVTILPIAKKFG